MEIRHMRENDSLLEISNIYEQSWEYAYQGIIPKEYLDGIPKGRWAEGIKRDGIENFLLIENEMMIGTASISKSRWERHSDYGEIVSIYLFPGYIGKGYGKFLLKRCMEELKTRDFHKILLWVLEDNHSARKFYEKSGFSCSGECRKINIGGKDLKEVMYFIDLDNSDL